MQTVTAADIKWGSYRQYEGPYYLGRHKFVIPDTPTWEDKVAAVVTATEGGTYDAYNGYDSCISTSGLIQMCEGGMHGVSAMLGAVSKVASGCLEPINERLESMPGYRFRPKDDGRHRFTYQGSPVDTRPEQQRLFLLNSDGTKGSWDAESKQHAIAWAVAISRVWENDIAQFVQRKFVAERLPKFCTKEAAAVLDILPKTPLAEAFRAAYYSFTANNPTWAAQSLKYAIVEKRANLMTKEGVITALRELTFHKGITIYPHRYNKIRPVCERLFKVDFPDFAEELEQFSHEPVLQGGASVGGVVWDTTDYQEALANLGYDLGPAGVDGKWGPKTTAALFSFEEGYVGMPKEYVDGKPDRYAQNALSQALLA